MNKIAKKLIMISAMYENGGNTTHRLLDGHPQLFVYPFESQLGNKYVNDYLSSLYPLKYRWPTFSLSMSFEEMYKSIIDEECKVRANTPYVSKFREAKFLFSDKERQKIFVTYLKHNKTKQISQSHIIDAFFYATFVAWKNYNETGKEKYYLGYSPIIGVDGEKIIEDFAQKAYVIHVIRNPFSAYGDTKKRPVPLSIAHYMTGWSTSQYFAKYFSQKYPKNFFVLRFEDIIANPKKAFSNVFEKLALNTSDTVEYPSFNKEKLSQVYPWGTIKIPTEEVNIETAKELNKKEIEEIYQRTREYIEFFNYETIYKKIK